MKKRSGPWFDLEMPDCLLEMLRLHMAHTQGIQYVRRLSRGGRYGGVHHRYSFTREALRATVDALLLRLRKPGLKPAQVRSLNFFVKKAQRSLGELWI